MTITTPVDAGFFWLGLYEMAHRAVVERSRLVGSDIRHALAAIHDGEQRRDVARILAYLVKCLKEIEQRPEEFEPQEEEA